MKVVTLGVNTMRHEWAFIDGIWCIDNEFTVLDLVGSNKTHRELWMDEDVMLYYTPDWIPFWWEEREWLPEEGDPMTANPADRWDAFGERN